MNKISLTLATLLLLVGFNSPGIALADDLMTTPFIPPIDSNPLDGLNDIGFDKITTDEEAGDAIEETATEEPVEVDDSSSSVDIGANMDTIGIAEPEDYNTNAQSGNTFWIWGSIIVLAAGGLYLLFQRRGY